MPPQISGCSRASVRPKPHSIAWPGLARSPTDSGWALRVKMISLGGELSATIVAASLLTAWNIR